MNKMSVEKSDIKVGVEYDDCFNRTLIFEGSYGIEGVPVGVSFHDPFDKISSLIRMGYTNEAAKDIFLLSDEPEKFLDIYLKPKPKDGKKPNK